MRQRRFRWWCLVLSITATGCGKTAVEPVWIGQLIPLEGANRLIGQHARQGVELAAAGAQIGGRPCAFLHVDTRGEAETVQAEAVRLLTVNRAAALLGDFDAALTERLLQTNQSYGVPVLVPGALPAAPDTDTVVSLGVPPDVRGRVLARHAGVDRQMKRAGVLTDSRQPVAAALAAAFVKAWPRGKGATLEEWSFNAAAERDERADRLIQAAPTVVLLACSLADFRALRPRLAAALPNATLLYGGEDADAAALQGELEKGAEVCLATAYSAEHLTDAGRDFARRYEERFHEPPDLYAAQSYDAARLLLEALQRAGNPGKEALRKEFAHREAFDSVTGPVRWKQRQPRRRVFVVELKQGGAKVVRPIEPDEE